MEFQEQVVVFLLRRTGFFLPSRTGCALDTPQIACVVAVGVTYHIRQCGNHRVSTRQESCGFVGLPESIHYRLRMAGDDGEQGIRGVDVAGYGMMRKKISPETGEIPEPDAGGCMTRFPRSLVAAQLLFAFLTISLLPAPGAWAAEKRVKLAHIVYFKLKDDSPEKQEHMVAACQKYLKDHPGVVFFAAGTLAKEFQREVNVRDWDIALHVVFENKKFHDDYQVHPEHLKFIAENKDSWAAVRVFDSYVE